MLYCMCLTAYKRGDVPASAAVLQRRCGDVESTVTVMLRPSHVEESSPASTLSRERSRVLDSRRWHMLCIYMALGILNQTLWLTFAAIPDATARRYDIPEQYVASLAVLCNAVYVPGSWICTAILRSSGLARVIKFACWLQLLGSLIRFLADAAFRRWSGPFAFLFLFIGQGVAALASPLIMNTPAVFANAWFGRREREGVLAVGALSPIFGQGSGPQRPGHQSRLCNGVMLHHRVGMKHDEALTPAKGHPHRSPVHSSSWDRTAASCTVVSRPTAM